MVGGKIKGARNCGYVQMKDLGCALVYARPQAAQAHSESDMWYNIT